MFNKRTIFILFIFILVVGSISATHANDLNQSTDIAGQSVIADTDDVITRDSDVETIKQTQKTFVDLNNEINSNNYTEVHLNSNYTYDPESDANFTDGIYISRAVTVWGNGHTINGGNAARIFEVADSNIIFHDLIFTNAQTPANGGAIDGDCTAVNCSFIGNSAGYGAATASAKCINCSFINNTASYSGGAACGGSYYNCTFIGNSALYHGGAIFSGSNMAKYPVTNCTFIENRASVGGAISVMFDHTTPITNCRFIRNSATWIAGAVYSGKCENCNFSENSADYGGAIKYGTVTKCIFTGNYARLGGASYQSTSNNCTFIENYADYGGATYDSYRTEDCRFIGNYALFGGAMYGKGATVIRGYFAYNYAKNGGATYLMKAENCFFGKNDAEEYGGAMYGESATECIFKDNIAGVGGNDTYNTQIKQTTPNATSTSHERNIIYFDAYAEEDGDGSENYPYKYLYAERITPGVIAYFEEGTYDLNSTITVTGARLVGVGSVRITSNVSNQYDIIIRKNCYLELKNILFNNINILNQAILRADDCHFEGTDVFDPHNLPEIEFGSGLIDSSYGGVIVCDSPSDSRSTLILDSCYFQRVYDAFNGGAIAAVNSDIFIRSTSFEHYSATYKGGAIYCVNTNMNIYNGQFMPSTSSDDNDYTANRYNTYTAYYGGSIYCENSNAFIDNSAFKESISFSFGGCIASLNSDITVRESQFNNSMSLTDGGGAIYNSKSKLHIFDSKFYYNGAEFGGAICNINSLLESFHSTYSNNHAERYGGVIYDIYGSMNYYKNWFYVSRAHVGGTIYTRIPNNFTMHFNTFGDSFANEGSSIFYDGKKENVISNYYGNDYHAFAEFRATLNGEDYYIISNPIYYQLTSSENPTLYIPYAVYEVCDGLVNMTIYSTDSDSNLSSIATGVALNNISINISYSEKLVNPTLNVYVLEDLNIRLYNYGFEGNLYTYPREDLFNQHRIVANYSIDLSDKIQNNEHNFTVPCTIDFENTFLSIKYDNLYEATSFTPVSLINSSAYDWTYLPSTTEELASYYNSNDYGFVSSVKDQKNGGNCWAFSGIATLEACLSKATGIIFDFSEENAKNLMAAYSVYGMKLETNYAGYESMLLSYLTSWLGPIDESLEDYDDYSSISILGNPMFHIQNVKFLPARLDSTDNYLYKLAIRDNGAVSVTFKWGDDFHSVSLVGWDDNYVGNDSLGKFTHGAWIFKNSWGPDWENSGFGYLSYDEKISEQIYPNLHAYTFVFNDNNPYTKIYQYDFAGVSEFYHYTDSIHFKNTFTADADSLLSAFSTYFDSQTNFTVSVYKNGQFVFAQNGTSPAGYSTIPFSTFIQLDNGDEFTIAINNHNKGYNCIPVCSAEEITKKTFSQNVSFISLDGETWFDLYDYADSCNVACIKAFTQNINLTEIRLIIDEFDSVNTESINIKMAFDNINANAINYCLVKLVIDSETQYAQIRNGAAVLKIKLDEGKHTLFAQYKDNLFESNAVQFNFTVRHDASDNSFNSLQDLINRAEDKSTVVLDMNYAYNTQLDDGEYGIHINKPMSINGNGHVINGLGKATGAYISASNVVLSNIVFANAVSGNGGGIYIAGRNVTLNNCSFINCSASKYGGGIYSLFDVSLNGCRFINDSAERGGGLYIITSDVTHINDCLFDNNTAHSHGSAGYLEGMGSIFVSSTNFTSNHAEYNGGAIFTVVYHNDFTDCLFEGNSANSGGAIFSNSNMNNFARCEFSQNSAQNLGGAIISHNRVNVYDCDFNDNAVIKLGPAPLGGFGGGAIFSFDDLNIHDSRFTGNSAGYGGSVYTSKYLKVFNSRFISNSASVYGGAIYTNSWFLTETNKGILLYSDAQIYDSYFEDNYANTGGAITTVKLLDNCTFARNHGGYGGAVAYTDKVRNCIFKDNYASTGGGAVYDSDIIISSDFIANTAEYGGAANKIDLVQDCNFKNNLANYSGGALTNAEKVTGCNFINNSAQYGGAILSEAKADIDTSNFTENHAEFSGGAIYMDGKSLITDSSFTENIAKYGGALYLGNGGTYNIEHTGFTGNIATDFGGAIFSYSETENAMARVNVIYCEFEDNNATKNGGAIYSDGFCYIKSSSFVDDVTSGISCIFSRAYFNLIDSNVTSSRNLPPLQYSYHYTDDDWYYGSVYLKNSSVSAGDVSIYYNENEVPYNMPLYLVFANEKIVKGETVKVARIEDENGNTFYAYGTGNLELTMTDRNGNRVKVTLAFDENRGGYFLKTSKINYGTYTLAGKLSNNHPAKCTVKKGTLVITDKSGRTAPVITVSGSTKAYVKGDKLTIILKNNAGKAIANCAVNVKVSGKTFKLTTDKKGRASMTVALMPKAYKASVIFKGNKKYAATSKTITFTVKKATLKVAPLKKAFKLNAKTKKYAVVLRNNHGKAVSKVKLALKVKGKTYKATSNAKGKATFNVKLNKIGTFKGTITFAGDKYCNKLTKKVTITVK